MNGWVSRLCGRRASFLPVHSAQIVLPLINVYKGKPFYDKVVAVLTSEQYNLTDLQERLNWAV